MLFFDDFIKKINNFNEQLKDKESFGLETVQKVARFGIILPILAIAGYWIFLGMETGDKKIIGILVGVLLILMALTQLRKISNYRMTIDRVEKILNSKEITLDLATIEECTLMEISFRKGVKPALVVIYKDGDLKKKLLIPLIMNNKVRFVMYFKDICKEKFFIKK